MNAFFKQQFAGLRHSEENAKSVADCRCPVLQATTMGILDFVFQKTATQTCDQLEEKKFTRAEVAQHCQVDSLWIIIKDHVYDITECQKIHPGGREVLLECAGHDATSDFFSVGHSEDALRWLEQYRIGSLIGSTKAY